MKLHTPLYATFFKEGETWEAIYFQLSDNLAQGALNSHHLAHHTFTADKAESLQQCKDQATALLQQIWPTEPIPDKHAFHCFVVDGSDSMTEESDDALAIHSVPKRIVWVTDQPYVGGATWHIGYLAHYMQQYFGVESLILFTGESNCQSNNILQWYDQHALQYRIMTRTEPFADQGDWLRRQATSFKADAVYIPWLYPIPLQLLEGPWKSFVIFSGATADIMLNDPIVERLDGILGVSEAMRDYVKPQYRHKYATALAGIPIEPFLVNDYAKAGFRARFNLTSDTKVVIWAGRIGDTFCKRSDILKDVMENTLAERQDAFFFICSGYNDHDSDLRSEWEAFAQAHPNVHIEWTLKPWDAPRFMSCADIYLCTSDLEGLSTTTMEAMAAAIPVVTTDAPGQRELIEHGKNGLVVARSNASAVTRALYQMLDMPEEQRRQIGLANRRKCQTSHSVFQDIVHILKASAGISATSKPRNTIKRIAYVVDAPFVGGLHWRLYYQSRHIHDTYGIETLFLFETDDTGISPSCLPWLQQHNVPVRICPKGTPYAQWVRETLNGFSPDVLMIGWIQQFPDALFDGPWKTVTFSEGLDSNYLYQFIGDKVDLILGASDAMKDVVPEKYRTKLDILPTAIPMAHFVYDEESRMKARDRFGLPKDKKVVVWTGRFCDQKRPDILIQVMERILAERDDVYFLVCTPITYDETQRYWEHVKGLPRVVTQYGLMPWDATDYMNCGDVYLSTSDYEGLSIATMEALAAGTPVVTTDATGQREIVTDGVSGVITPLADVDALVQGVYRILDLDPAEHQAYSNAARRRIAEKHDIANYALATLERCERLIRTIKVAIIDTMFVVGGAEWIAAQIVLHSDPDRYEYCVFTCNDESPLANMLQKRGFKVSVSRESLNAPLDQRIATYMHDLQPERVRAWKPDIVFCTTSWHYHEGIRGKYRVVIHGGQEWNPNLDTPDELALFNRIAFVSRGAMDASKKIVDTGKAVFIPNAIDTEAFTPDLATRSAMRKALGIPEAAPVCLWIGRMAPRIKGIPELMQIIEAVSNQRSDVHFLVLGYFGDGELTEEPWSAFIANKPNVHWLATVHPWDAHPFYAASDYYLSTSHTEGLSLTTLQALSSGLIIVTTQSCGQTEIVHNNMNGFVAPVGDVDAFVKQLYTAFDLPDSSAQEIRDLNRSICKSQYDIKSCVSAYTTLFEDVMKEPVPSIVV